MLITNHVVQGAAIGRHARRPHEAFALGLASHFLADSLPHHGKLGAGLRSRRFLALAVPDGLTGLAALITIAARTPPPRRPTVVAGMLGACLPDLDKPFELVFGRSPWPGPVNAFHRGIQREAPTRLPQEILLAAAGFLLALRATSRARSARAEST